MIYKGEESRFVAIPIKLFEACLDIENMELRKTFGDILKELSNQNKKIDGEWYYPSEGYYPLTWASKRLGKNSRTIYRHLTKLAEMGVLTISKKSKGYKVGDNIYFHSTIHIKLTTLGAKVQAMIEDEKPENEKADQKIADLDYVRKYSLSNLFSNSKPQYPTTCRNPK
jgi:DNA-binding transcriptional ArsR family regulator